MSTRWRRFLDRAGCNSEQVSGAADGPLDEAVPGGAFAPFFEGDAPGELDVVVEEGVHLRPKLAVADDDGAFGVVFDAAVVEVGGADDRRMSVDAEGFGVEDGDLALVDFDAGGEEAFVEGAGGDGEEGDVVDGGEHQADADFSAGGAAEVGDESVGRGEIGHREGDAFFGAGEHGAERFPGASAAGDGGDDAEFTGVEVVDVFGGAELAAVLDVAPGAGKGDEELAGAEFENAPFHASLDDAMQFFCLLTAIGR